MKKFITGILATFIFSTANAVEIEFAYPYSGLFDVTYQRIMPQFEAAHPDIKVKFRATYENYEDATSTILREATSGNLPDVTMQGLNRQAPLVDKGIAKSLEPFIANETDFEKDGYHSAMLSLSTFGGEVYGLPFSVSTPIGYYNVDLMSSVGITDLPSTWDEVIDACGKLAAAGHDPMWWGWSITGNWFFQALMHSQGEPMVKDGKVNIGGQAGLNALNQMKAIFDGCDMNNYSNADGLAAFNAGKLPMFFWSTSSLGSVEAAKGDWVLDTEPFPGIPGVNGGTPTALPAGGNAAMFVSTSDDPERIAAAWTFLKYITSGVGAAAVAETTGYVPPNKAANELLGDFYDANPNKLTAVDQLPLLADWFAYPGQNGLAITQVIYDYTEMIVTGEATDMAALQEEMMEEIEDLM